MSKTQYPPLEPNSVYHIFTHAVENNNLFVNNGNYDYFLRKWQQHTEGYLTTYSFCLMPNHVHFSIKTADDKQVRELNRLRKQQLCEGFEPSHSFDIVESNMEMNKDIFSHRIKNFLTGYTQALNKQQSRKGALVRSRFGRIKVMDRDYFRDLTCYIHHNPIHHFGVDNYNEWMFSSYNMIMQPQLFDETYGLNMETVISVFGSIEVFFEYHKQYRLSKKYLQFEKEIQLFYDNNQ